MTDIIYAIVLVVVHTPFWAWLLYAALGSSAPASAPLWRMLSLPVAVTLP